MAIPAIDQLASLEEELELAFRSRDLLRLAMAHGSYLNENPTEPQESNERLEFLGDALIGLVVAHHLYKVLPEDAEGELTSRRSALVREETLARTAASLELGRYLLMGKGEEAGGGRSRPSNLAAAFEALVGAVLIDQGYDAAEAFVLRTLSPELSRIDQRETPKNSKSELQEMVQGRGHPPPVYRVVGETGEDHAREFMVEVVVSEKIMGRGGGRRKSVAEQEAASQALKALGEDA